jgi:hypothetical protein
MEKIIENGEELNVTRIGIENLLILGMVYYCPDCGFYHCVNGFTLNDIETTIKAKKVQ